MGAGGKKSYVSNVSSGRGCADSLMLPGHIVSGAGIDSIQNQVQ